MIKNKHYYIKKIDVNKSRALIKKYHYSHKFVRNSQISLGIYRLDTNCLVGTLQYGPSINGYKTTRKFHISKKCMELNRMVMIDEEPRNAESQAISLSFKYLKKYTDLDYVISFSDGKEGNVGYIYQATNWKYVGYRLSNSFYDLDDKILHSITVWHRYKEKHPDRLVKTTHEILCDNFNNVSIITSKQHIYLYPLHNKIKFLLEEKSYPKLECEIPILKRKIIKQSGKIYNPPLIKTYTDEYLTSCI